MKNQATSPRLFLALCVAGSLISCSEKDQNPEPEKASPSVPEATTPAPSDATASGADSSDKPDYPIATPVPGKPGYVFSPYNNHIVDVKGIPAGTLVRDPVDKDQSHKFRLP